jgi:hypothetical protein
MSYRVADRLSGLLGGGSSAAFEDKTDVGVDISWPPLGGRFRIIAPLASGGMGAVYRALDLETRREVAVKVPHLLGASIDRRFKLEVDAVSAVVCPSVAGFVAKGTDAEPYLAMELVRGKSLARHISDKGPLGRERALLVARRLAAALAVIHLSGWVHRDVKPGNVVITEEGGARLVDFGLARSVDGEGGGTETGQLLGTLGYSAPEQFSARRIVDPRTDVFALGCVLYEALSGRRAFRRDVADILAGKWAPDVHPPLDMTGVGIDADVVVVLESFAAIDPARRPADGLAALGRLLSLDPTAALHLEACETHAAVVRDVVATAMRRPVCVTGPPGGGKTSTAIAAAILMAEIYAPAAVVVLRGNPRASRVEGGHANLLERLLRASGYTAAARVLLGQSLPIGEAASSDPQLVVVVDDASFCEDQSLARIRALGETGVARVITTCRPGVAPPPAFAPIQLHGVGVWPAPELASLPDVLLETLRRCAAFGTVFDGERAARAGGDRRASLDALAALVERGILRPASTGQLSFVRASHWEHLVRTTTAEALKRSIVLADGALSGPQPVLAEAHFVRRTTAVRS